MGGSVVSNMARANKYQGLYAGVILIDVFGNIPLDTFDRTFQQILNRPSSFESIRDAINWSLKTKFILNTDSANISIPPLLYENSSQECMRVHWKTDLASTSRFWQNWFGDFSDNFLRLLLPKLIILSDIQLLDNQLTKAQIQGKLQITLIAKGRHLLHEEQPAQVALAIIEFVNRLLQSNQ